MLSKMHYAAELAAKGHTVYFVNPPRQSSNKENVYINDSIAIPHITIINTQPVKQGLLLRHKFPGLYRQLTKSYVKKIKKITGNSIDELWCFNPNMFTAPKQFKAKKTLLMLYDFYKGKHIEAACKNSDALISITHVAYDFYKRADKPSLLLSHGLAGSFAVIAEEKLKKNNFIVQHGKKIKIGYTGNLLRHGMNTLLAKKLIEKNPQVEFHFWGPDSLKENNVSGLSEASQQHLDFLQFLKKSVSVVLHGVKAVNELAEEMQAMDAFIFLYSAKTDINAASNSHKILEYLSTGKAIISTFVSQYQYNTLLVMSKDEASFLATFEKVISSLPEYNAPELQKKRIAFALENTYHTQIERINRFIKTI